MQDKSPHGRQYRHVLIALLILLASVLPISASAQDTDTNVTPDAVIVSQLTAIATASLQAQLDVLTNSVNASGTQELAIYYQAAIQQKITEANNRRAALLADGIIYGKYNLQFSTGDIQIDDNAAILQAIEYTAIELENAKTDPLSPQTTEYIDEHTFYFQSIEGDWYLAEDQVRMPPNAEIDPQLGPITDPPSSTESNTDLEFSIEVEDILYLPKMNNRWYLLLGRDKNGLPVDAPRSEVE
ncbi:MAG: hypothetical protein KF832_12890 [Caldilineaceae bacterium]|nr:hypothetical protein [Caldilineaceae bacterium]